MDAFLPFFCCCSLNKTKKTPKIIQQKGLCSCLQFLTLVSRCWNKIFNYTQQQLEFNFEEVRVHPKTLLIHLQSFLSDGQTGVFLKADEANMVMIFLRLEWKILWYSGTSQLTECYICLSLALPNPCLKIALQFTIQRSIRCNLTMRHHVKKSMS